MTFYELFLALCEDDGVSIETVSRRIGVSTKIIRQWKHIKTQPKFETTVKICQYFRLPNDYFKQ